MDHVSELNLDDWLIDWLIVCVLCTPMWLWMASGCFDPISLSGHCPGPHWGLPYDSNQTNVFHHIPPNLAAPFQILLRRPTYCILLTGWSYWKSSTCNSLPLHARALRYLHAKFGNPTEIISAKNTLKTAAWRRFAHTERVLRYVGPYCITVSEADRKLLGSSLHVDTCATDWPGEVSVDRSNS